MTPSEPTNPNKTEQVNSRCILAVNDDADELFLIARHLGKTFPTARILTAADGADALKVWQSERIDAVVTDNKMPRVTGLMLVRKIREMNSIIPIVMATGSERDRDEALASGATVFYTDCEPDGISQALKKCFGE